VSSTQDRKTSKRRKGTIAGESSAGGKPERQLAFSPIRAPTYTQVPDVIFDELLDQLTGTELKVLLYICRRTFGWGSKAREGDAISFEQFLNGIIRRDGRVLDRGCGVKSPGHLSEALKFLEAQGVIESAEIFTGQPGRSPKMYRLRMADNEPWGRPTKPTHRVESKLPNGKFQSSRIAQAELPIGQIQETVQNTDGQQAEPTEGKRQDEALAVHWEMAKVELVKQMSTANYQTWFRDTRLVALSGDHAVISAPNAFTAEWLSTRCTPLIQKTLSPIVGHAVEIRIVTQQATAE
jgi:hypothetical protein